jgi:hypothetical protein
LDSSLHLNNISVLPNPHTRSRCPRRLRLPSACLQTPMSAMVVDLTTMKTPLFA